MKLVILIPAYNEEQTIESLIESIPKTISGIETISILVIDDGSTDKTANLAKTAGAIVISHNQNLGVGSAFKTGLNHALELDADILVNIDADGQFSAKQIPLLIDPIMTGNADFVSGDRFRDYDGSINKPEDMSSIKYWGNKQMARLISILTQKQFTDVSCGFRAYSKEALLNLNLTGRFTYTQETFLDLANKDVIISTLPVKVTYFPDRKSRVAGNIGHYIYRTVNIIFRTYRDYRPLRFFTGLGIIPFLFGLACGIFTFVHYLNVGKITPYKSLGIIGIYLISIALILWIVGILADMFVRLRINQERILYFLKKKQYSNTQDNNRELKQMNYSDDK